MPPRKEAGLACHEEFEFMKKLIHNSGFNNA
jgi:hypothetical protein